MIIDKKQLLENCLKESEYLTSIVDLMKNAIIENDAPKDPGCPRSDRGTPSGSECLADCSDRQAGSHP